jgi:hypothetical protein
VRQSGRETGRFPAQPLAAPGPCALHHDRHDFIRATRDAFAAGLLHAGLLILTRKLPRDPARVGHALSRWVEARRANGRWPMQSFEIDFLSD